MNCGEFTDQVSRSEVELVDFHSPETDAAPPTRLRARRGPTKKKTIRSDTLRPLTPLQRVARRSPLERLVPQCPSTASSTSWASSCPPSCPTTTGWDFAPACRPTVRRSPSPLGLGESHSFQRPIPKPPEPPVEAQSSQFNPSGSMSRKAGTGGARRHVDRRGRPRVRRAPEGGQDRGSSRRARTRPAGAPSAAERALRAIANLRSDAGPRAREP